jgi:hypothetical protein
VRIHNSKPDLSGPIVPVWELAEQVTRTLNTLDIAHSGQYFHASGDAWFTVVTTPETITWLQLEYESITAEAVCINLK